MKTKVRRTIGRAKNGHYDEIVEKVMSSRSRHFHMLNTYGNPNSAGAIVWMVEHGKGIVAFTKYPPGTFEAEIRGESEVWFRKAA
jgi:hypothetical protein